MVASLKNKIKNYFAQTPIQRAIHEILISAFLLTLPFYLPAPRNIAWVIIGTNALIAVILHKSYQKNLWQEKKIFLLLSIFLFLHFVGMFYTQNTEWGWFLIGLLVPLWVLPLSLITFSASPKTLQNYLRLFIIGLTVFVILCYARAFYRAFAEWNSSNFQWSNYFYYQNFTAFRSEPTYLGILLCLACLFIMIDFFLPQHSLTFPNKIWSFFLLLFFLITLLLLSVRMQIGILLLGFGLIFLEYYRKKNKIWQGIFLNVLGIGVLTAIILFNPYTRKRFSFLWNTQERIVLDKIQDHSLGRDWDGASLRFAQWTCSIELIRRNWLTGVGTGDGQDELQKIYEEYKFYFASRYNRYNAHNQFLETWIALGVTGFLLWISLFVVPVANFWRTKNYLALAIILVLFFSAFTESYLQRNYGVIIWGIFYGLALVENKSSQEQV
ncbi:MAG: O-antigen ligase family protein [Raineya sp.]|nr:O-antigen ligase family protein [Raineya sp.]